MTILSKKTNTSKKEKNSSLLLQIVSKINESLTIEANIKKFLNEQAIPVPPQLSQGLQKEKGILQQILSGQVQKGVQIQGSEIVNQYLQQVLQQGLRDPNQITQGFDQFYMKKQGDIGMKQALAAKKQVVAPTVQTPKSGITIGTSAPTSVDKSDPFGFKARAEDKAAQERQKANLAAQRKATMGVGDYEDKLKKKMMKEGSITNLINFLVSAATNGNDSAYSSSRRKFTGNKEDLEYIDALYSEIKELVYRLKRLSIEQQRNPSIKKIIGSGASWRLSNAIKGLESATQSIETALLNRTKSVNQSLEHQRRREFLRR